MIFLYNLDEFICILITVFFRVRGRLSYVREWICVMLTLARPKVLGQTIVASRLAPSHQHGDVCVTVNLQWAHVAELSELDGRFCNKIQVFYS